MILSWMAYASLCASVCAIAAACVDSGLRHRLRQRRGVWLIAMLTSVVLPLAIPFLVPPRVIAVAIAEQAALPGAENPLANASHSATLAGFDWGTLIVVVWVACSVLLASSLMASSARLRRRLRGYRKVRVDGQSLLVSEDFGPAVVGLLHTTIVLPTWALTLSDADRRLVVAHEVEHQRASDPAVSIAALVLVSLFPWNAALWWQLSRLRLAIEFDCDARVIEHNNADPFAYGNLLVAAHENAGQSRGAVLALAPMRSALGKRINALVATDTRSLRRSLGTLATAALALSALGFAPVPTLPRAVASTARQTLQSNSAATDTPTFHLREKAPAPVMVGVLTKSASKSSSTRPRQRRTGNSPTQPGGTYSMTPQSEPQSTLGSSPQSGTARFTPDSASGIIRANGGTLGSRSGAVMRAGGGQLGGAGGSIKQTEVLKSYTGGFMNAEVPARADSIRPPIR